MTAGSSWGLLLLEGFAVRLGAVAANTGPMGCRIQGGKVVLAKAPRSAKAPRETAEQLLSFRDGKSLAGGGLAIGFGSFQVALFFENISDHNPRIIPNRSL